MEDTSLKMHTDVAEMKGMLTTALASHSAQLVAQEGRLAAVAEAHSIVSGKVSELSGTISGIVKDISDVKTNVDNNRTESIQNHNKDIAELKLSQTGMLGKVMMVVSPVVAALAIILAITKDIYT